MQVNSSALFPFASRDTIHACKQGLAHRNLQGQVRLTSRQHKDGRRDSTPLNIRHVTDAYIDSKSLRDPSVENREKEIPVSEADMI